MSAKPNLLVVGNYNRKDFIDLFDSCRTAFNFYFIEFASRKEVASQHHYKQYGKAIFWGDYRSAKDLLLKVNPHKVVFFFIESYFHVLLNLACKDLGIPTYLMDHGIRDVNINLRLEPHLIKQNPAPFSFKFSSVINLLQVDARIRARLFLLKSIKELTPDHAYFFKSFYKTRSKNNFIDTFKKIESPLRIADAYLAFSPKTYQVHQYYDHLPANKPVHYIGIPSYDHLAIIKQAAIPKKQILFLDQGLVERGFFGWTRETYTEFVSKFTTICHKYGHELLVKLHPVQIVNNTKIWTSCPNARIIDNDELADQLPFTSIIIGLFSTYLLPLAALPHTTLITLENHPAGKLDVSKSFIEAGVAKPVYDLQELHNILPNIEQIHQQQLPNKAKFTEEWMYKFDGKAGERLRDILLSDKL